VALLLLIGIAALSSGPATAAMPCTVAHDCGRSASLGEAPAGDSCIRDASCGGGVALEGANVVTLLAVAAAGVAIALPRLWWRLLCTRAELATRVLAGELFRPPRLSF
jgi:hypothetical protein